MKKGKPRKSTTPEQEAAFVMEGAQDRFHSIIVSDPVRYAVQPDAETIINFFVIRRGNGTFDIVNVNKTFEKETCVSRNIQTKAGISEKAVESEIDNCRINFALKIQKATGFSLKWNTLDLSDTADRREQVRRIQAWGRVGVRLTADMPINLN